MAAELRGARPDRVREAIDRGTSLTGHAGFAGMLPDGRLVRDVLGRVPLFVDAAHPDRWGFRRTDLDAPTAFPAGHLGSPGDQPRRVWTLPDPDPFADDDPAIRAIDGAVQRTVDAIPARGTAIGFSGGVDSALLARCLDVPLYTVGVADRPVFDRAREVAGRLGRDIVISELDHDDLRAAIPSVVRATGRTNAMDVAIGISLFHLAERVAADGYDRLVLGQGADELFGGYEKIAHVDHRVEAETVAGARREVLGNLPAGLERDVGVVATAGVTATLPYLTDRVLEQGLRLDASHLVRDGVRKWALRVVADRHLPTTIAFAEKSAIQYGNGVARELDRLARRAGFKRRDPGHVDRYVRSVCDT